MASRHMSNQTSTDSQPAAGAPHAGANPLSDLIARAEVATCSPTTKQANKVLLKDLCVALVALAQRVALLEGEARPSGPAPRLVLP